MGQGCPQENTRDIEVSKKWKKKVAQQVYWATEKENIQQAQRGLVGTSHEAQKESIQQAQRGLAGTSHEGQKENKQ